MRDDTLRIGRFSFSSRLFVGTGKYKDIAETARALAASGAEAFTVPFRRVTRQDRWEGWSVARLPPGH